MGKNKKRRAAAASGTANAMPTSVANAMPTSAANLMPTSVANLMPFVSICTPTFNRRPFIPSMIKCFEHQDYPKDRIEWILSLIHI